MFMQHDNITQDMFDGHIIEVSNYNLISSLPPLAYSPT